MHDYFPDHELACKCCGVNKVRRSSLEKLIAARIIAGVPFRLRSAYRCPKHNEEVGSTSDNHIRGCAFDIEYRNSREWFKIVDGALKAGFKRIGINQDLKFIHIDDNENHAQEVIFSY